MKDDFTLEKAEHKIKQQELEIEKLKRQLARQRFFNLPKEEIKIRKVDLSYKASTDDFDE